MDTPPESAWPWAIGTTWLAGAAAVGALWKRINGVSSIATHAKNNRAQIELAAAEKYSTKADLHELGDRLGQRITELRDDIHRGRAEMMAEIRALAEQRRTTR